MGVNQQVGRRQTLVSFGRGLFALNYAGCENPNMAPRVRYAVSRGVQGQVRILPAPGLMSGELNKIGDIAVIAADVAGALDVVVEERQAGGGVGCSLSLDRIGGSEARAPIINESGAVREPVPPIVSAPPPRPTFRPPLVQQLVAHLSYRGDVAIAPGEWIGGPQAPTPIEGFAIPVSFSEGEPLEYQVLSLGSESWSNWATSGAFVGTRGQGRPLRGVRLRVPQGAGYTLRAEALFLGSTVDQKVGAVIEFISSSPFDAMVGLRIGLVHDAARDVAPVSLAALSGTANRLKVFRSSRG